MLPPSAALPADLALMSLTPLLGPLSVLAVVAASITLVVMIAGIAADRRDAGTWPSIPRPASPRAAEGKPISRSAA